MKKEISPYRSFSLEKIEAPKPKKRVISATVTKSEKDLRIKGRNK